MQKFGDTGKIQKDAMKLGANNSSVLLPCLLFPYLYPAGKPAKGSCESFKAKSVG